MDSSKMCYTCLKTDCEELIDLYKTDCDEISYLDKLRTCLMTTTMHLMTVMEICCPCINQLKASYKFVEMVRNAQEVLTACSEQTQVTSSDLNIVNNGQIYVNNTQFQKEPKSEVTSLIAETETVKSNHSNYDSDSSDYFLADLRTNDACNSIKTYSCKNCNKIYLSSREITEHVCEASQEKVVLKGELEANGVDKIKTKCKENKAQKSTKKVKNRPSKYTKKPKPDVNYTCEQCDISFNKRWKLQKHMVRVHVQDKKYKCTYCNRAFKQSYHLREHITSHTGERKYSCTVCDKTFQRISSQRRHIKSHDAAPGQKTKRTPFLCTICGKSFPFSNGVQRHMRIHLGIKSHECHECKRRFTQSTHLHVHMRTHTGEKPYICDTCGEAFPLKATLQKHMTHHDNEELDTSLQRSITNITNQNVSKNAIVSEFSKVYLMHETR